MAASAGREVESLDVSRPRPAKAALTVNHGQSRVGRLIAESMRRSGGQKCAAITLSRDEAQLSRELLSGTFRVRDLDALDEAMLGELGAVLISEFGGARVHPLDRAALLISQLGEVLMEAKR